MAGMSRREGVGEGHRSRVKVSVAWVLFWDNDWRDSPDHHSPTQVEDEVSEPSESARL